MSGTGRCGRSSVLLTCSSRFLLMGWLMSPEKAVAEVAARAAAGRSSRPLRPKPRPELGESTQPARREGAREQHRRARPAAPLQEPGGVVVRLVPPVRTVIGDVAMDGSGICRPARIAWQGLQSVQLTVTLRAVNQ